jgi:hypothetical protein
VTRLKMMIDQTNPTLDKTLNDLFPSHIRAVSVFDLRPDFHDYTKDRDLIQLGHKEQYIFLTSDDKTITKTKYPPCKHGGIIKMPGMPSKEEVLERVRKLIKSGPHYLKQIRGHFTRLNNDGAVIYKEHDQVTEVKF